MNKYTNIKKAWNIIENDKKYMVFLTIYGLFYSAFNSIIPALIGIIVSLISDNNLDKACIFCIIVIFVYVISYFLTIFHAKIYCITKNKIIFSLRKRLSERILDLESKEFDEHTTGLFLTRMKDDPENIVAVFNEIRLNITRGLANIGVIIYIFILNWIIGIIYLVSFILIYIVNFKKIKKFIKKKRKYLEQLETSTTIFGEMVKGIKDIKLLNLKKTFVEKQENTFMNINNADADFQMSSTKYYSLNDLMQNVTSILVVIIGIYLIYNNMLTVSSLLVIFMYKDSVYDLLKMITSLRECIQKANVSIDRMFEIIESDKFKIETYGNNILMNPKGKIEFRNVQFGYKNKKVIKDFNLIIKPNENIAIVGKSGTGKSTIFNLVTKSYNVDEGEILIDDIEINALTEKSIKDNISMISQNPYIFNMTILENLKLVKPEATNEEIINVCKLAQIHDFIISLEHKYNTLIGEGGVNLSGGEKQRLAIARALLRNSKIILFDEATSALDNETQSKILKSINSISKDHTIIIIAHRLSTIKECNKIIVIDKGKIVGEGNHNNLIKNCSLYAKLYKSELIDK